MLPNPISDYQPQTTYFCIDIEANGPILLDMVSWGLVVYADDKTPSQGNQLYLEIRPQTHDLMEATAIHRRSRKTYERGLPRPGSVDS